MKAVEELSPAVETSVPCAAIGVPRATVYRHRTPKPADAPKPCPAPPRALSGAERRNQLRHPAYAKPQLVAIAPNQVWTWDITKLLGPAKWTYHYLYVILDIYSRHAVG
jgi:transposase InsO family protein